MQCTPQTAGTPVPPLHALFDRSSQPCTAHCLSDCLGYLPQEHSFLTVPSRLQHGLDLVVLFHHLHRHEFPLAEPLRNSSPSFTAFAGRRSLGNQRVPRQSSRPHAPWRACGLAIARATRPQGPHVKRQQKSPPLRRSPRTDAGPSRPPGSGWSHGLHITYAVYAPDSSPSPSAAPCSSRSLLLFM